MPKRTSQVVLVACLATVTSWAADNPFVGRWKLNPAKSRLTDVMEVKAAGGNKYTFDFGSGPETIVADGTDQSGGLGSTVAVTIVEPDTWKIGS